MVARSTKITIVAFVLILISVATVGLRFVLAPPASSAPPGALSEYGVVRVYASIAFTGTTKIAITSSGSAPFFVSRLTIFLNNPSDFDIVLSSVNIDGIGAIQVSGYSAATKTVVVPAGLTYGDIVTSFPSSLSMFLTKDPLGNDAVVASGGDGNGVVVGIGFMNGGYSNGATLQVVATVVAPTNGNINLTLT